MKNNILNFFVFLFFYLIFITFSNSEEQFIFEVTQLDVTENGNLIVGSKSGKAITNDGFEIIGNNFVYNKETNILNVSGNVKLFSIEDDVVIFSDKATYLKNDEVIFTEGNSKALNENNVITADKFNFDKIKNILKAENNVKFEDKKEQTLIFSDKATYLKNDEVIFTEGETSAFLQKKYKFESKNVTYSKKDESLKSLEKSLVEDNNGNTYNLESFFYKINSKILKGKNINVFSKVNDNNTDKYFFSEGIFNFAKNSFLSKETKIKVHKEVFDNEEQDPRIYGVSSKGDENSTIINKGIFTSCKLNDNCPPWSIESEKITHDKIKKDMIYEKALLKIYDFPVLYFPKFFHPDPTVDRRTGFLRPQFNNSKTLGSSIFIPYFVTLGDDRDYTFKPTIFNDKIILQNEFRKVTENSYLITDFSLTKGYKSSVNDKKKDINHLFLNYEQELNLPDFNESKLEAKIERVNNDTYLKVFQNNLFESPVIPKNKDIMLSELNLDLDHQDYSLSADIQVFEDLGKKSSDRYQYVLPSYNFNKNLNLDNINGSINFISSGSNHLKDTNNLRTSVINDIEFRSINYFSENGFKNQYNLYFKNLNSLGKNDPTYKSTPRVEGMGIAEIQTSFPLIKNSEMQNEILTPKISLRANPGNNMKDYSSSDKNINANNIFEINRLGLSDTFEAGRSLTLGIDYKIDKIESIKIANDKSLTIINEDINQDEDQVKDKFIEFKLATVLRDKVETEIPSSSTIDKKNSNIFGSINNQLYDNLDLTYNFSINNNLETLDYHSLSSKISINNFVTEFTYLEERDDIGSSHVLYNKSSYEIDKNNSLSFSTRRNKEINLTEYYDFSYEYKNDCLIAGVKYNKTFYQDNDLKPSENLFFTITLIPLTTYERIIYEN